MRHSTWRRHLNLEHLEDRCLLAGNVLAKFNGLDLVVRGDSADNQIQLMSLGGGTVRVQGINTTVNGQAFFDTPALVEDIAIRMLQGGTDQFMIQGAFDLEGGLTARLGAGSVLIEGSAGPVVIREDLRIHTGAGGDVTLRNEVRVRGDTEIDSGGTVNVVAGRATLPDFASAVFSDSLNIDNPYFPLVVGTTYTYESVEDGEITQLNTVEVLPDTRMIQGVEARVIRDRVFEGGNLIEDTFDFHAQDDNGNVWYLGEAVTNYEYDDQGNFLGTNSGGSWLAGVNGAAAGIIMEANPHVGDRYYQEFNANDVMDQGEVLAKGLKTTVPAGTFMNVLRTKDVAVTEPGAVESKFYAPGLGPIQELGFDHPTGEVNEIVRLTSVTLNGQPVTQVVPPTGFVGANVSGRLVGRARLDGAVSLNAADEVVVIETAFGAEVAITSDSDVSVADAVFAGNATLVAGGTVGLRNLTAKQTVQITAEEDVHILDSKLRAGTQVTLGSGDNTLAIKGSVLASLEADGGMGLDSFLNGSGNSIARIRLKRFEMG